MPIEPPQQFGRYRIVKKLGEGGMGAVYEAEDTVLGRRVALKVPRFDPEDIKVIERFYREARSAAAIHHPNICPVFDVGEVDGTHFLTMPLLDGRPLSRLQNPDQPWPEQRAAELVRKVALAMQLMHHKGMMHRDLKPSNIMIQDGGEPIIMDFGLARSSSGDDRLTTTNRPVGTPAYMSPEQITGDLQAMGPSCDIYSLGVILYELLAGRLPFVGPWSALFGQILHVEPPPLSSFRAGLDPALEAICLRAMAKKARNRYASMADFAAALDSYLRRDARPPEDDRRDVTDNAGTLPEPPPPATSGLRFDGLYQCGDEAAESRSLLRFLEDGRVFSASSISAAPQVARWLGTHHWDSCGNYQVVGDTIEFEEDGAFTTIRYCGRILLDGLRLETNSRTSGSRSENAYRFVPLDLPPLSQERWPADTVSDHEFASLCARQPARAGPDVELRYDGLYQSGGSFLRFYPDGRVAGASTFDDPMMVAGWLGNSAADSRGRYRLRDASIAFELDSIMATVKYAGHLRRDGLELEVHSLKNDHRSTVRYSFQPLDFAAATSGAKLSPKVLKSEDDPVGNTMSLLVDNFDMAFVGTVPYRPRAQPAAPPQSGGGSGRDWSLYNILASERLSLASVPRGKREERARSVFQELESRLRGRFSEQQGYGFVATRSDSLTRDPFHIYIRKEEGWEFSVFLRPSDNDLNELVVHRTDPRGAQVTIVFKTGFGGMVLVLMILFGTGWYNRGFVDWAAFLGQALTWSLPAFFGCLLLRVVIFWLFLRPGIKRDAGDIDLIIHDVLRETAAVRAKERHT